MKCVCGYEHKNIDSDNPEFKPFIPLIGSDTYFQVQLEPGSFARRKVNLYVCPECGTIKMENNYDK